MEGAMMFEVAESYEAMMRRWSRQLAPLFVEFVGVRMVRRFSMLDVAATLARVTGASKIDGIDPSKGLSDMLDPTSPTRV
jgi:hypothetical protein